MVKKLFIILSVVLLLLAVMLIWYDQSRSYYCLSKDKCITVWKRLGNKCYIIPGKYRGALSPKKEYVKTTNTGLIAAIWVDKSNKILIDIDNNTDLLQLSSGNDLIKLYGENKTTNDSLFTDYDGKHQKYKNEIDYLIIDIRENYAIDNTGEKLK